MEIAGIAKGIVSAIVGIAALVRDEVRRAYKRRVTKRLATAAVIGLSSIALIGLLGRRP